MFKDTFDKNTILGIILIITMVGGYFYLSKKRFEDQAKNKTLQKELKTDLPTSSKAATIIDTNKALSNPIAISDSGKVLKGDNIELSNELITLNVNTVGAKMNNAVLKNHKTYLNQDVKLLNDKFSSMNLSIPTAAGFVNTANLAFQVVSKSNEKLELATSNGIKVSFVLQPNSYVVKQIWSGTNSPKGAQATMQLETQMNRQETNLSRERQFSSINYLKQNEEILSNLSTTKSETIDEKTTSMKWISCGQQFFNVSVIPQNGFSGAILSSQYNEEDTGYVKKYNIKATLNSQENNLTLDYFIGPSEYKLLKKEGKSLELIVPLSQNFILFRWMKIFNIYLIIPIFDFLSKFFSNYGIIILLMTLFIKIITAPLSYKTYKSGVAMKILKPQLDLLKKKYGDDQQKYSQEQMKIFNEVGVSPFGGCLPMLLQMPILFAMFNFFPSSIELRHQPFLWAHDLSTYDNILNLPFSFYNHISLFALLTALTQIGMTIYSQRLQPSSPQADQMKMMTYMMPVIFLFMFNSFPAALTYYYFLQNILSMIQQWFFTTFIIKEDKVRAEMELAKKEPKKQGGLQKKMAELMEQAEQQKKMQQNQNKK